ncbi:MAG: RDD family protein [Stappiaceae bacterium]
MSSTRRSNKRRLQNFIPPEGVPITFDLSSLGSRLGAQILDVLITYGGATVLVLLLAWTGLLGGSALLALFFLLTFFIRIPYYIFAELVWNGRTLGKKITQIRVISATGRRLTPHQIVARNLMKEVEVFLPITTLFAADDLATWTGSFMAVWMVLVLIVPFVNRKKQRLGDMIADTIVVEMPKAILLPDLANAVRPLNRQYVFNPEHLEIYGRYELQTLETILRTPPNSPDQHTRVRDVTRTIIRKIGYTDKVAPVEEWDFLLDFYRQQRSFLENRHLFGDSRQDKFHADAPDDAQPASESTTQRN